ncbi:MAG: ribosomal RNA small subunit methyltransferase A [Bacteroidetes bacterium]|nr:ribosomal RNA small subunit methyltransferase A [Bacteroidota bacterium]
MSRFIRKKRFGQHFLNDQDLAEKIVGSLEADSHDLVLEIGPGKGVLTTYLHPKYPNLYLIELDRNLAKMLKVRFSDIQEHIIQEDFLKYELNQLNNSSLHIIGNFPYNISSQIVFKMINSRALVVQMVGMFQREVAERIVSPEGNKTYGILSVLTQAYFDAQYLFEVNEDSFDPPPKVRSAVIRLTRKPNDPECSESILFEIVKRAFNQRRKMLRNTLKDYNIIKLAPELATKRPEQLDVDQFINLATLIEKKS